jgi:hypothetical protein
MGRLRLIGGVTKKEYQLIEETANVVKLKNVIDGVDYATFDSTTIKDAGGVALNSHASRHAYGGADALPAASIDRSQCKPFGIEKQWSASPTPGTGGAYGSAVALTPASNKSIVPLMVKLTWGGTFAAGETVTIRLTVKFSDGSTKTFTKSGTATGDYWLTDADKASIWGNNVYVTEIDVDSSSSAASTSVTTSATIYGIEI